VRLRISSTYFATGAQFARDRAAINMQQVHFLAYAAGGPLDAPAYVPAGSHNSTDVRDWRGNAVPHQTINLR